ncbi:MAG: methylmalonyl-CoA mutase family protein [Bacteroidota bacterium]
MAQSQQNNVYSDFGALSYETWKAQVIKEVKGEEAFAELFKTSAEGITSQPYYTLEDLANKEFAPLTKPLQGWKITEYITVQNPTDALANAERALLKGTDKVVFIVTNEAHIAQLSPLPANTAIWAKGFIPAQNNVFTDALMELAEKGELEKVSQLISPASQHYIVDASVYHNAGAETASQLAFALAHANEYLNLGVKQLTLNFAVGSNYFFEVAKLRAARKLYALLARQYGINEQAVITCETALNNKTIYDYNNNILRATTETMAAVIGGCDVMYVHPYDVLFKQPNDFSARIARNVQLVLKHESYMDKVQDAAAGSYYIETLTEEIAAKSWQLFQEIEAKGGWITCLQNGELQKTAKQQADAAQKLADDGQTAILGVNKYPNKNETMKAEIEPVKLIDNKFFPLRRFAANAEQQRINEE